MRARALVHIAGPDGAGKTTFVEALLRARNGMIAICVRAQRDTRLRREAESAPRSHSELRRYRAAGASAVALYRFPAPHGDAFFMSDVMQDYSEVVLIEGDCPLDYVDPSIYVAPPLPRGAPLLRRVTRDYAGRRRAALRAYEQAIDSPAAMARFLGAELGEPLIALALRQPGLLEDIKRGLAETVAVARREPPPAPTEHWALRGDTRGSSGPKWSSRTFAGAAISRRPGCSSRT